MWEVSLAAKDQPLIERTFQGMKEREPFFWSNHFGSSGTGYEPPCLVRPLVDLDGDGTPDLIWASRTVPALAAISGKTGKLLWCHECQAAQRLHDPDVQDLQNVFQGRYGNVVGKPFLAEVGGKSVVVCVFALNHASIVPKHGQWVEFPPQVWLEAIDAKNGATLWRRQWEWLEGTLDRNALFAATTWKQNGRALAAIACQNRLYGFDVLTGQPAWPDRKLDEQPPLAATFANLRGGVEPELVLLKGSRDLRLTILSPRAAAPLWERPLTNLDPVRASWTVGRDRLGLAGHCRFGRKGKTADRRAFRRSREPCQRCGASRRRDRRSPLDASPDPNFRQRPAAANLPDCRRSGPERRRLP